MISSLTGSPAGNRKPAGSAAQATAMNKTDAESLQTWIFQRSGRRRFAWLSRWIDVLRICWKGPALEHTWAAAKSLKRAGGEWYKTFDKGWTVGFEPVAKTIGSSEETQTNRKKLLKPFQGKTMWPFKSFVLPSSFIHNKIWYTVWEMWNLVCPCLWIYYMWNYNKHYSASRF